MVSGGDGDGRDGRWRSRARDMGIDRATRGNGDGVGHGPFGAKTAGIKKPRGVAKESAVSWSFAARSFNLQVATQTLFRVHHYHSFAEFALAINSLTLTGHRRGPRGVWNLPRSRQFPRGVARGLHGA